VNLFRAMIGGRGVRVKEAIKIAYQKQTQAVLT
jgi:hypothetical protein